MKLTPSYVFGWSREFRDNCTNKVLFEKFENLSVQKQVSSSKDKLFRKFSSKTSDLGNTPVWKLWNKSGWKQEISSNCVTGKSISYNI